MGFAVPESSTLLFYQNLFITTSLWQTNLGIKLNGYCFFLLVAVCPERDQLR